ncbi:ATP-binding protein [Ancylothrix sp. C2]|uniref:hybrid sensor histidine kinase/response regulator n=1 Tax=Ancylothrix sp. D3o TaxID=2953691 RepID=UPI0021BAA438|nr:ATP-binding protein [Ancylothrix sp. D3o]MCT7950506.1 ATP-binding protein [Ancylothrix sp. D3o]
MNQEQIEKRLRRLKEEQELILNQVDNAIALFDLSDHLILFNRRLADIWGISSEWLQTQPHCDVLLAKLAERGCWSSAQGQQLREAMVQTETESVSFYLEQANGICLEVYSTLTSDGGRLFTFRDVTVYRQSQDNLNAEVRRLRFLLGLTERLQASVELREIGHFALSYLVEAMNAAFGDVKVINGEGVDRYAGVLTNQISTQFIATYGAPAVADMQTLLNQGIPYGQGLLWDVIESGVPLFVDDYQNHPKAVKAFRHPAIGQLGVFPIPSPTGTIIGVLTLESRNLQKLQDAPNQDMLLAACRTLGVAIERARAQEHLTQVNKDLERASQLKSEFLASMSHELRTPLNSIIGFSDLLQRQTAGSLTPRQINHVKAIETSGQHLLQLINDILDLSKIEAGKVELTLEPVAIQELCTQCLRMIQPRAEAKSLALALEWDYRLDRMLLDERRVSQMLINLLSNAVKFTPERGKVKLAGRLAYGVQLCEDVRPDQSPVNPGTAYLCLEVSDSGIGIPPEKWHLLFRPFQQIDASLSRRHEGTGLGLALTKRLAELHGGTVSFQSVAGEGSVFRVWIPMSEFLSPPAAGQKPVSRLSISTPAAKVPPMLSKRILVVEDQPSNQVLIAEFLESEGYMVELISDGNTMLQTIHSPLLKPSSLPDLILMDVQLPGVDGFELMRLLKANSLWQTVPVVAVTALAMSRDRERCLAAGADEYLSKPLNLEQVICTVRSLIGIAPAPDSGQKD